MIDLDLSSRDADAVGRIKDLVLDSGNRNVAYGVVACGGLFGMGTKYFAMPWHLIDVALPLDGQPLQATLRISRDVLRSAPGFDANAWPSLADARWSALVDAHFRPGEVPITDAPRDPIRGPAPVARLLDDPQQNPPDVQQHRLSKVIGMSVVDAQHRALATVEDLIVDVHEATVDGVLIAFGGILGFGERLVLIPADSLRYAASTNAFVLASNRERLATMAIVNGEWPALDCDDWLWRSRERLTGAVGGIVPNGVDEVDATVPDATDARGGFGGLADRVFGTIVTMGSASMTDDSEPRLRLRVRTDDGREVVVRAAAVSDKGQAALPLRNGQVIEIRGWRATQGTQTILVASSLTVAGRTVDIDEGPRDEIRVPQ